jgi:hypothetical protein
MTSAGFSVEGYDSVAIKRYKTLESWIKEAISDSDKEKPCSALACVHKKEGGGTKEVHSRKLEGKTHTPSDLADLFKGKAESFAQDLGGIQKFELQAFYGTNEAQASHTFTVVDGEVLVDGHRRNINESPDGQGIVAQSMRHTERAYEAMNLMAAQTMAFASARLEKAADREEKLQLEVSDAYTIVRDLLMKQADKNHEHEMAKLEYARKTEERGHFFRLGPALVNTASGREVFPQATADTALLDSLAEKVDPKMLEHLTSMGLLPAELAGPLTIRLTEAVRKKDAEREAIKEATKNLVPASPDPRIDAAGGDEELPRNVQRISVSSKVK